MGGVGEAVDEAEDVMTERGRDQQEWLAGTDVTEDCSFQVVQRYVLPSEGSD